jgi:hypothetical protein
MKTKQSGALVSMPNRNEVQTKIEVEKLADWLKRMAQSCAKEMPGLYTKNKNGKEVKVNFHQRLKEIYKSKGHIGVEDYLQKSVADYNKKLTAYNKSLKRK